MTGAAVKLAEERGVGLDQLTLADLQGLHGSFEEDVALLWSYEHRYNWAYTAYAFSLFLSLCVCFSKMSYWDCLFCTYCISAESRNSVGGTSKARVLEQIATIRVRYVRSYKTA